MSSSLRAPWLGPIAEKELRFALDQLHSHVPGTHLQRGHMTCSPDEIVLEFRKKKNVQAIGDFETHLDSTHAVVSDGTGYIRAKFKKSCIELFEKQFSRPFQSIQGGILILSEYKLVLTSSESFSDALFLNVSQFKLSGSEGSKTFGLPIDIAKEDKVKKLCKQLAEIVFSSVEYDGQATQRQSTNRGERIVSPSQVNFNTQVFASQLHLERPKTGSQAATSATGKRIPSQTGVPAPNLPVKAAVQFEIVEGNNEVSKPSRLSTSSSTSTGRQDQGDRVVPALMHLAHETATTATDLQSDNEVEIVDGDDEASVDETGQQSRVTIDANPQYAHYLPFVDSVQVDNPFVGLKRVPRKFVRISRQQQPILEANPWYQHGESGESECALLPDGVKQSLLDFLVRRHHAEDPEDESDESSQSGISEVVQLPLLKGQVQDSADGSVDEGAEVDEEEEDEEGEGSEAGPESERSLVAGDHSQGCRSASEVSLSDISQYSKQKAPQRALSEEVLTQSDHTASRKSLELAIPVAMSDFLEEEEDDEEEELEQEKEVKETTITRDLAREYPSTAVNNSSLVQVERTPYVSNMTVNLLQSPLLKLRQATSISSDPVIPATNLDLLSQASHASQLLVPLELATSNTSSLQMTGEEVIPSPYGSFQELSNNTFIDGPQTGLMAQVVNGLISQVEAVHEASETSAIHDSSPISYSSKEHSPVGEPHSITAKTTMLSAGSNESEGKPRGDRWAKIRKRAYKKLAKECHVPAADTKTLIRADRLRFRAEQKLNTEDPVENPNVDSVSAAALLLPATISGSIRHGDNLSFSSLPSAPMYPDESTQSSADGPILPATNPSSMNEAGHAPFPVTRIDTVQEENSKIFEFEKHAIVPSESFHDFQASITFFEDNAVVGGNTGSEGGDNIADDVQGNQVKQESIEVRDPFVGESVDDNTLEHVKIEDDQIIDINDAQVVEVKNYGEAEEEEAESEEDEEDVEESEELNEGDEVESPSESQEADDGQKSNHRVPDFIEISSSDGEGGSEEDESESVSASVVGEEKEGSVEDSLSSNDGPIIISLNALRNDRLESESPNIAESNIKHDANFSKTGHDQGIGSPERLNQQSSAEILQQQASERPGSQGIFGHDNSAGEDIELKVEYAQVDTSFQGSSNFQDSISHAHAVSQQESGDFKVPIEQFSFTTESSQEVLPSKNTVHSPRLLSHRHELIDVKPERSFVNDQTLLQGDAVLLTGSEAHPEVSNDNTEQNDHATDSWSATEVANASSFDKFRTVYPDYTGSRTDFTLALVYIEYLLGNGIFGHSHMCDDFIRFYPEDYLALGGDKMKVSGWDLFKRKVRRPVFEADVICAENIAEALESLESKTVTRLRSKFAVLDQGLFLNSRLSSFSRDTSASSYQQVLVPQSASKSSATLVEVISSQVEEDLACVGQTQDAEPNPLPHKTNFPRRPFFETASQLPMKRKSPPASPQLPEASTPYKRVRTLPWETTARSTTTDSLLYSTPKLDRLPAAPLLSSPILGDPDVMPRSYRGPTTRDTDPIVTVGKIKELNRRRTLNTPTLAKVDKGKGKQVRRSSSGFESDGKKKVLKIVGSNPDLFKAFMQRSLLKEGGLGSRRGSVDGRISSTPGSSATGGKGISLKLKTSDGKGA